MGRMYSRKKGKSGSTRPAQMEKPAWLSQDDKTIRQVIAKLAKEGKSASVIGTILRDSYGIPEVKLVCGASVGTILKEEKLAKDLPEDLIALITRDIALAKHRESNHKDMTAKRGQELTMSKIHRLVSYYKKTGVLAKDWTYDRSKAAQWIV